MQSCYSWSNLLRRARQINYALPAIISLAALLVFTGASCVGNGEKEQVGQLRKIAGQTPVFPAFQAIDEKVVLKHRMVSLFVFYRSPTQFSEIKKFYDNTLPKQGWGPPEQAPPSIYRGEPHSVSYRRGGYQIAIEQDGNREDRFHVVFKWFPK